MLITIQFPIVDLRAFIDADSHKLGLPSWIAPDPNRDFIRSFGAVRRRPRGGLSGWLGESHICEADRAIRFQGIKPLEFRIRYDAISVKFKVAFRRFYFDGLSVGKFEIGLAAWGFGEYVFWDVWNKKKLSAADTKNFFSHILQLPIVVSNPCGESVSCQLWQAGRPLAKLYAASTTLKQAFSINQNPLKDWWVQSCEPIILITYQEDKERLEIPFWGKVLNLQYTDSSDSVRYGGSLSHYTIPHEGEKLRMWLIGEYWASDGLRLLRIFLLRLHAERVCLRQVLRDISTGKLLISSRSTQSRMLQEYLNQATKRIKKLNKHADRRHKFCHSTAEAEVGELAREAEDQIAPGECDALFNALRMIDIEKNIFRKVEDFVQSLTIVKEQIMGDQYNISGQAGAVGSNAHAHDMTFNQIGSQLENSVDLLQLADELSTLRQAMVKEAIELDHSIAVGDVAKAEQAAKSKDATKVAEYLKSAGKWTLDIASKIGVPLAIEALKRSMGIPI
jgi:hypothetical protein